MSDRRTLETLGEVGECLRSGDLAGAQTHLFDQARSLVNGVALWWTVSADGVAIDSELVGLDTQGFARWHESFYASGAYQQHPMWTPLLDRCDRVRTHRRHELVSDREWKRSAYHELTTSLGCNDTLASVAPLVDGRQIVLSIVGARGETFTDRDAQSLHRLHAASVLLQERLSTLRSPRERNVAKLPPRHRRVLALLLEGMPEKIIASELGKSPRTIHKYVEGIYRALGVTSRAELMALWIEATPR